MDGPTNSGRNWFGQYSNWYGFFKLNIWIKINFRHPRIFLPNFNYGISSWKDIVSMNKVGIPREDFNLFWAQKGMRPFSTQLWWPIWAIFNWKLDLVKIKINLINYLIDFLGAWILRLREGKSKEIYELKGSVDAEKELGENNGKVEELMEMRILVWKLINFN